MFHIPGTATLLSQDSFMRHIKQPNHKRKGCKTAPGLLRFQVTFTVLVWSTDKPKPSLGFKYPFRDCRQRKYLIIHRTSDFLTKHRDFSDHPMFLKLRIGCFCTNWMSSIGTSLTMRAGDWRSVPCPTWQRTVPSVAAATSSSHSMVATRGGAAALWIDVSTESSLTGPNF